jgi:hypothetical protein
MERRCLSFVGDWVLRDRSYALSPDSSPKCGLWDEYMSDKSGMM